MIGEVRVLSGGVPSIDFCSFDNFVGSRKIFFTFTVFSTRSFDRNERLNMAAGFGVAYRVWFWLNERRKEREVKTDTQKIDWALEEISRSSKKVKRFLC